MASPTPIQRGMQYFHLLLAIGVQSLPREVRQTQLIAQQQHNMADKTQPPRHKDEDNGDNLEGGGGSTSGGSNKRRNVGGPGGISGVGDDDEGGGDAEHGDRLPSGRRKFDAKGSR